MNIGVLVASALRLFALAVIVQALLSWFPARSGSIFDRLSRALRRITDPVLRPVRNTLRPIGGFDFSPVVVLLLLNVVLVPLALRL